MREPGGRHHDKHAGIICHLVLSSFQPSNLEVLFLAVAPDGLVAAAMKACNVCCFCRFRSAALSATCFLVTTCSKQNSDHQQRKRSPLAVLARCELVSANLQPWRMLEENLAHVTLCCSEPVFLSQEFQPHNNKQTVYSTLIQRDTPHRSVMCIL